MAYWTKCHNIWNIKPGSTSTRFFFFRFLRLEQSKGTKDKDKQARSRGLDLQLENKLHCMMIRGHWTKPACCRLASLFPASAQQAESDVRNERRVKSSNQNLVTTFTSNPCLTLLRTSIFGRCFVIAKYLVYNAWN